MVNVTRGQKQTYTIGLTAYRIGINYTNNLDFIGIIEPELKAFAKNVGKTVSLASVQTTKWFIFVRRSRRIQSLPRLLWEPRTRCTVRPSAKRFWLIPMRRPDAR